MCWFCKKSLKEEAILRNAFFFAMKTRRQFNLPEASMWKKEEEKKVLKQKFSTGSLIIEKFASHDEKSWTKIALANKNSNIFKHFCNKKVYSKISSLIKVWI